MFRLPSYRRMQLPKSRLHTFDDDGSAMAETVFITPVIVILIAGILEFGAMLVSKFEMELGLRDAARYLSRCQDVVTGTATYGCSETIAQNIAVYGSPAVPTPAQPRVLGWQPSDVLIDSPAPKMVSNPVDPNTGQALYNGPANIYVVRVSTTLNYAGGPLLGLVGFASIPMSAYHEERHIGW